jgi:uncharacterized protein
VSKTGGGARVCGTSAAPRPPARDVAHAARDVLCLAVDLTAPEIRVLGCLLEKQRTTPEAYPLSLNALRLACNQSTNRDPVVQYDEATIRDALHRLSRRRWTRLASGQGSRAPKYRHLLDEALPLPSDQLALLCVLMLRGAQTPGELKQRTERLHPLPDLDAVHAGLERLIDRELARRLERRPGQKEERYTHRLGEDADDAAPAAAGPTAVAAVAPPPVSSLAAPSAGAGSPPAGSGPGAAPPGAAAPPETAPPGAATPPATAPPGAAAPGPAPAERDPRVARLENEVAALRDQLCEMRAAGDAARAELTTLRADLDALRADLGA